MGFYIEQGILQANGDAVTNATGTTGHLQRGGRRTYSQPCPVAHSLDLLGERWTLLMVRDLMFGPLRFSDLRDGLPGLAPNLLSDRLRMLTERGIIEKVERPTPGSHNAYQLTRRGRELAPVIHALARFGVDEWTDPEADPPPQRLLRGALLALMEPESLDESSWTATLVLDESRVVLRVARHDPGKHPLNRLRLAHTDTPRAPGTADPGQPMSHSGGSQIGAVVHSSLGTLWDLKRGTSSLRRATDEGLFSYDGPADVFSQLKVLLGLDL